MMNVYSSEALRYGRMGVIHIITSRSVTSKFLCLLLVSNCDRVPGGKPIGKTLWPIAVTAHWAVPDRIDPVAATKRTHPISRRRNFDARSNIRFHFRRKFAPDSIDAGHG